MLACSMPPLDDQVRLKHLREAAEKAIRFSTGKTRDDLGQDELLRLALTKLVEIVGEAAKQVSQPTRPQYPSVPWTAASRMRDHLIHHYFDIDLDILWATVSVDLPELLDVILSQHTRPPMVDE